MNGERMKKIEAQESGDKNSQQCKARLRKEVRERLAAVTAEERATGSQLARFLLERQPRWKKSRAIFFFAPLAEELDVWPLLADALAAGKMVALPRFDARTRRYVACEIRDPGNDLKPGKFGIREPAEECTQIALNRLDFTLVPGIAFDLHGRRLGRGQGFYDHLLADVRGTTCGVVYDQQIVEEVPVEPHDAFVNCILTPTRWIEL